jgi:polyphenol oxidase
MTSFSHDWLQPDWPAPPRVQAVMTDRHGGVSPAPWDSMNLGDHVGDLPHNVQVNRQRLQAAVGTRLVFLKQVHGLHSVVLAAASEDGVQADACVTTEAGVACTIMVADCLPVLLCDAAGRWVAAAHAGWRGLAGEDGTGVLEALLNTGSLRGTPPSDILVWLGPCIGPQAFEVGPEVRAALSDKDPAADVFFKPLSPGKWLADLAGLARLRLQRQGVHRIFGNDSQPAWCTVTQASRFFSHRRDARVLGQSGRMAACIWLTP